MALADTKKPISIAPLIASAVFSLILPAFIKGGSYQLWRNLLLASGLLCSAGSVGILVVTKEEREFNRQATKAMQVLNLDRLEQVAGMQGERTRALYAAETQRQTHAITGAPAAPEPEAEPSELQKLCGVVEQCFKTCGVDVHVTDAFPGPAFVRFSLVSPPSLKFSKIKGLEVQLQMQMSLPQPPVVSIADGVLSLDVPLKERAFYSLEDYQRKLPPNSLPLGVGIGNNLHVADLNDPDNPHFLVAGRSGSGKSEWLVTAIESQLRSKNPPLISLIDIKQTVSMRPYQADNRLMTWELEGVNFNVATSFEMAVLVISRFRQILDDRINQRTDDYRRIVLVIDEIAELLTGPQGDVIEKALETLARLGREYGLTIIAATQHPTTEVLSTQIRANMPCRICLNCQEASARDVMGLPTSNDPRSLLGKGDLYFMTSQGEVTRLQGLLSKSTPSSAPTETHAIEDGPEAEEIPDRIYRALVGWANSREEKPSPEEIGERYTKLTGRGLTDGGVAVLMEILVRMGLK